MQYLGKFIAYFSQFFAILHKPHSEIQKINNKKLRAIRKEKGMSQEKIANLLCTDTSNYSRKERGEIRIQEYEWEKIANILEVPVEDIKDT